MRLSIIVDEDIPLISFQALCNLTKYMNEMFEIFGFLAFLNLIRSTLIRIDNFPILHLIVISHYSFLMIRRVYMCVNNENEFFCESNSTIKLLLELAT